MAKAPHLQIGSQLQNIHTHLRPILRRNIRQCVSNNLYWNVCSPVSIHFNQKQMLSARDVPNLSKLGTLFGTRHLKEFYTPTGSRFSHYTMLPR